MQKNPSDQELKKLSDQGLAKIKAVQADPKWQKFSDKPCLMYKMQIESRVMSKGQIKVNMPIHELFDKLSEQGALKKINSQLKEIKVIYQCQVDGVEVRVNYQHYSGIWPVEDRDLVCVSGKEKGDEVCYIATQHCDYDYPKQNKVTRAICHIGGYVLKKIDEQNTMVVYISDVDLAGSIPQMIKNQLAQKQASLPASIEKNLK